MEQYNKKIDQPISEKLLKKEVDFVQQKLKKYHPNLHNYISEKELNRKFDSVKSVLIKPISNQEFFMLISPVVASIKQGHMSMWPPTKKISKKESKRLANMGAGPLSQFEFEWMNNKLYIIKNKSNKKLINLGAEVVSINSITPQQIYDKYRKTFTSDGFNSTYITRAFSRKYSNFLTYEIGINDSLKYVLKQNDSIKSFVIYRLNKKKKQHVKKKDSLHVKNSTVQINNKINQNVKKLKRIYGYSKSSKTYSKELCYIQNDSSSAVLKIKDFSNGQFKKAYKNIFNELKTKKIRTLIIDLRNNPGGRVSDAVELYSYLSQKDFQMLEPAQVVSKTSLWKLGMFSKIPKIVYPIATLGYPLYMAFATLKTKKNDNGTFTYNIVGCKKKQNKANFFSGKIYVIINGNSFSAACLVSSALKENKEVTFVGEETGGAFNSTVAGLLPILKLPYSKINLRMGLMDIGTTHKTNVIGRGVFPDQVKIPTLTDKIENKDPEMEWIMSDLKSKNN